jgi:hypothetical protein
MAIYFKPFIENYSDLTAPLSAMTHKNFDWRPETWTQDYRAAHARFKGAILSAQRCFFPDYSLPWRVQCDASDIATGGVLLQDVPSPTDPTTPVAQPVAFCSSTFSGAARNWDTHKKEAYGLYKTLKDFRFFLLGKEFVLETDHKNLLYIENSDTPIIVRWRTAMQAYRFKLRHISGARNVIADTLSRPPSELTAAPITTFLCGLSDNSEGGAARALTVEEMFERAHGGRQMHPGARRTWILLNDFFPGHRIPYKQVAELVFSCPTCQKMRLGMEYPLEPITRNTKVPHSRKRIGMDHLYITPADSAGNKYILIVVEMFTHYVRLFPVKDLTAQTVAQCLFLLYSEGGLFDELISDPGSAFTSEVVQELHKWLGVQQRFSLVDRHESSGVEPYCGHVLRLLRVLCYDERMKSRWSEPTVLAIVAYTMNTRVHSESGVSPFEAKYGSEARTYGRLPPELTGAAATQELLRLLDEDLRHVHALVATNHAKAVAKRAALTEAAKQNEYQAGDFVLFQREGDTKLAYDWLGPLVVVGQHKNDVTARHMATGVTGTYHVTRLKLFAGTEQQAREAAMRDADHYTVTAVISYRGNPVRRTETAYLVVYGDGDRIWRAYAKDLADTEAFAAFCATRAELLLLLLPTAKEANDLIKRLDRLSVKSLPSLPRSPLIPTFPSTPLVIGMELYIDLRVWSDDGHSWYFDLSLPQIETALYVVRGVIQNFAKKEREIVLSIPIFDELLHWSTSKFFLYGRYHSFEPRMTLVDVPLVCSYPELLPPASRRRLLREYKA